MGVKKSERGALLERLLVIAKEQKPLFAQNRFADLARTMAEREEIVSRIKDTGGLAAKSSEEAALVKEILGFDTSLRVSIEGELEETSHELKRLSHCNTAHRAYVSSQVKMPRERSSRDG